MENVYVKDYVGYRTFIWIFEELVVRNGSGWNWIFITSSVWSTVMVRVYVLRQSTVMSDGVNV
jgi:hypothetical protein